MKILYFSPRSCWPLHTGARLRDYHLARQLTRHAAVTYLGLHPPAEPAPLPPPDSGFHQVHFLENGRAYTFSKLLRGLTGPHPITVLNYTSARVKDRLADLLRQHSFDCVQVEGVHLVNYIPLILRHNPRASIIADWHNIESEILWRYSEHCGSFPRSWFARRTARLLESSELRLLHSADTHIVTSDREREILQRRCPQARVATIPNGVDVAFFRDSPRRPQLSPPSVLFVGSMDYHANVDAVEWFVRESWPALHGAHPDLQFVVVGRNPPPSIRALAGPAIRITGTVDDVREYYAQALAVVVPLRVGSGTRLKILEAMAAGVPVVSTRLGAEGIPVTGQHHLLLADSGPDLAACLTRLITQPDLRLTLVDNGRALVTQFYDWEQLGARLWEIHQQAITLRRRR
jgi:glycosyltransferase involved in cell wall biosynthesis